MTWTDQQCADAALDAGIVAKLRVLIPVGRALLERDARIVRLSEALGPFARGQDVTAYEVDKARDALLP